MMADVLCCVQGGEEGGPASGGAAGEAAAKPKAKKQKVAAGGPESGGAGGEGGEAGAAPVLSLEKCEEQVRQLQAKVRRMEGTTPGVDN